MTIAQIVETIINTRAIAETSYIGGMARLARDADGRTRTEATEAVQKWWLKQGGSVAEPTRPPLPRFTICPD